MIALYRIDMHILWIFVWMNAAGERVVGTMLLQQARAWAKERNLEYIELGVLAGNEGASRLYEKMGFSDVQKTMRCRL